MTEQSDARNIRAVLLDIEGTTTPIAFVHNRLFSYARERLDDFLERQWDTADVREVLSRLKTEHVGDSGAPDWNEDSEASRRQSLARYVRWLMDRDRKSPGLKMLQGLIWEEGYQQGLLRGEVYDDVPDAMRRWRKEGRLVAIYSSGSELAQRRLFQSTTHGDLTSLIFAFFDTAVGAKSSPDSYRRIASDLGVAAGSMLFVSDVTAELNAARQAGCHVVLSVRPGNPSQPDHESFDRVESFASLPSASSRP